MKFVTILLSSVIASQGFKFFDLILEEWEIFKLEHGKKYDSDVEDKFRMNIYMENKLKIAKRNAEKKQGHRTYKLGMNKYGDMLHHEFTSTMNGFNHTTEHKTLLGATFISPANIKTPDFIDWREIGAVTTVKDQENCSSCWAFSATGALEGQTFRKTGKLVPLSEQNLIDCSGKYGSLGCSGGYMIQAFEYVKDNKGINTEKSYPYEAQVEKCRYNPYTSGGFGVGFTTVKEGDENKLQEAVATIGPICVAIDASHDSFQFYKEGVYYEPDCSNTHLGHAALVVGYGTDRSTSEDYWIVKNSWGTSWGEQGYIKMARNHDNNCGIASMASYPLV